jgi:hypothetical protein
MALPCGNLHFTTPRIYRQIKNNLNISPKGVDKSEKIWFKMVEYGKKWEAVVN